MADAEVQDDSNKVLPSSPVTSIHSKWIKLKKNERQEFNRAPYITQLLAFFDSMLHRTQCIDLHKPTGRGVNCHCLNDLCTVVTDQEKTAVAEYLLDFALLDRKSQQFRIMEWMECSTASREHDFSGRRWAVRVKVYVLPGSSCHKICRNSIARLVGFGRDAWLRIQKCVDNNQQPVHGLEGRKSNNVDFDDILQEYFDKISKFGAPRSTRLVRDLVPGVVNTCLRDSSEDIVELPTSFSKSGLYARLCLERGWFYRFDSTHRIVERRKVKNVEQLSLPSWRTFLRFWKKKYPKLIIQKPSEDICGECFVYANKTRYSIQQKSRKRNASDDGAGLDEDDDETDEDEAFAADEAARQAVEEELRMLESEKIVQDAAEHVEMTEPQLNTNTIKSINSNKNDDKNSNSNSNDDSNKNSNNNVSNNKNKGNNNKKQRKWLSDEDRERILLYLLSVEKEGKLPHGSIRRCSERFGVNTSTISLIWSRAIESATYPRGSGGDGGDNDDPNDDQDNELRKIKKLKMDVKSRRKENSGPERKRTPLEIRQSIKEIPFRQRKSLRMMSEATGIPKTTLYHAKKFLQFPTLIHVPKTMSSPIVQVMLELDVGTATTNTATAGTVEIELQEMNDSELKTKEQLAINPMGTAPTFQDGDIILWESGAIIDYLLGRYDPAHRFHPPALDLHRKKIRAAVDDNNSEQSTSLAVTTWAKYLQLRQYIISTVDPFVASLFLHSLDPQNDKDFEYIQNARKKWMTLFGPVLSMWLGSGPWFLGNVISVVDFLVCKPLNDANAISLLENFPSLQDLLTRIKSRPSFDKAYNTLHTTAEESNQGTSMFINLIPNIENDTNVFYL